MTTESVSNGGQNQDLRTGIIRRVVQVLVTISIQALVLFLAAGTIRWWGAWAYIGLYLAMIAGNAGFMMRRNPQVIAERGRASTAANWQDWDKIVGLIFALFYFAGILLVAGLDKRLGWTATMAPGWRIGAFLFFILGSALFSWAMIVNAYFSTAVRIQEERDHTVCDSGPYRYVRHPGYVGAILQSLAAPLILGSWWALIPGGVAAVALIVRTGLEDQTLHEELEGYPEYAVRVRYRLLPGVW